MLGGGIFVTQNKTLPGSYINVKKAPETTNTLGDRGIVAIALPLNKDVGKVITLEKDDFLKNCQTLTGKAYDSDDVAPLREIFVHASKVFVYDLGTGVGAQTVANALDGLEAYSFNILCAYTSVASDITTYTTKVTGNTGWRDGLGKKCQVVVYNTAVDHEGVINVVSTVSDDGANAYELVAWVAGAEAGCPINSSCTNMLYDGEFTVTTGDTQSTLEGYITAGKFAFHNVYGEVRVLEDINSLTTTTTDKTDDFKYNQVVRVADQIVNDVAKLFNTKYLGKIQNNESGRVGLWGDLVAYHKTLEELGAIEVFDASLLTVEQGTARSAVVVTEAVLITNAMAQLYMTVLLN